MVCCKVSESPGYTLTKTKRQPRSFTLANAGLWEKPVWCHTTIYYTYMVLKDLHRCYAGENMVPSPKQGENKNQIPPVSGIQVASFMQSRL